MHYSKVFASGIFACSFVIQAFLLGCGQTRTEQRFAYRQIEAGHGKNLVVDLDNDGINEILKTGSGEEPLVVYEPDGKNGYKKTVLMQDITFAGDRVHAGDVDQDGDVDLVSGLRRGADSMFIGWLRNPMPDGNPKQPGSWQVITIGYHGRKNPQEEPIAYTKDIGLADFNGDGLMDVATRTNIMSRIFFQKSATEWSEPVKLAHDDHEGMDVGDMDQDGDPDLVLNGFWFETPDDAVSGQYVRHDIDRKWCDQDEGTWRDDNASVKVADINGDGLPDLLISQSERPGFPISFYTVPSPAQARTGPWQEHQVVPVFDYCQTLDAGDLDNDGDMDIVAAMFERDHQGEKWRNYPPFTVAVLINVKGDGSIWRQENISETGLYAGLLGDVDSDGDLDLIGPRSYWTGPTELYENLMK